MRMVIPHGTGRLLNDLSSDMNALFESVLGEDSPKTPPEIVPLMDVEERADAYVLVIDLPGVQPDDIHVDLDDGRVSIHGVRKPSDPLPDGEGKRRVERSFGEFRRVFRLPKAIDQDAIVAHHELGVLTVTLPKAVKNASRRIKVEPSANRDTGSNDS